MIDSENISGDIGKGWRSPRVEAVRQERQQAEVHRRSRRAFLKRLGVGGAAMSADGRSAISRIVENFKPDGFLGRDQVVDSSGERSDQASPIGIPLFGTPAGPNIVDPAISLDGPDGESPDPRVREGGFVEDPTTHPDGSVGDGRFESTTEMRKPATGEAGFGDENGAESGMAGDRSASTGEGSGSSTSGQGTGTFDGAADADGEGGTQNGVDSDAAVQGQSGNDVDDGREGQTTESTPGGILDPYQTPSPVPTPDPRRIDPFGSDSAAPEPDERSVITPRIPNYNLPEKSKLVIASLGVNANMVPLGIDAKGRMLAPDAPESVGWFELGPLPGTPGNAILTGHVDWNDGSLGVFSGLKDLNPGQIVDFFNPLNGLSRYLVKWQRTYVAAKAPISEILAQDLNDRELTLITCAGTFDQASRNYSHRLIVRCGMD